MAKLGLGESGISTPKIHGHSNALVVMDRRQRDKSFDDLHEFDGDSLTREKDEVQQIRCRHHHGSLLTIHLNHCHLVGCTLFCRKDTKKK
jgi:hypothetical protein